MTCTNEKFFIFFVFHKIIANIFSVINELEQASSTFYAAGHILFFKNFADRVVIKTFIIKFLITNRYYYYDIYTFILISNYELLIYF